MGDTLVIDGCPSHGEGKTSACPVTREFGWDRDFDDRVGLGAGVPVVYTTIFLALIGTIWTLICWVSLSKEKTNELLFWHQLPRLRFEKEIWPSQKSVSIKVATDANDFAWGVHTLGRPLLMARE